MRRAMGFCYRWSQVTGSWGAVRARVLAGASASGAGGAGLRPMRSRTPLWGAVGGASGSGGSSMRCVRGYRGCSMNRKKRCVLGPLGEDDADEGCAPQPAWLRLELRQRRWLCVGGACVRRMLRWRCPVSGTGRRMCASMVNSGGAGQRFISVGTMPSQRSRSLQAPTITSTFCGTELPSRSEAPKRGRHPDPVCGGLRRSASNPRRRWPRSLQKEEGEDDRTTTPDLVGKPQAGRRRAGGAPRTQLTCGCPGGDGKCCLSARCSMVCADRHRHDLPARLESNGTLRVQVRPGAHVITVVARHIGPVGEVRRPQPARWPAEKPGCSRPSPRFGS